MTVHTHTHWSTCWLIHTTSWVTRGRNMVTISMWTFSILMKSTLEGYQTLYQKVSINAQRKTEIYYMCSTHTQRDNENNEANRHNGPRDSIMQCRCGCFFHEGRSCLPKCNSWFPTTKKQSGWKANNATTERVGVGGVLMNKWRKITHFFPLLLFHDMKSYSLRGKKNLVM